MSTMVYKFERDMLKGEDIHINKRYANTCFKKHWHNYFEIIYYKNCDGYCVLNGVEYAIDAGCLFFLTPKDFHEIVTREKEDCYSVIVSFNEQIVDKRILSALTEGPIVLYDLPLHLADSIDELYDVFCGDSVWREQHLEHLLNGVLIEVLDRGKSISAVPKDMHPIVRESISYMLTNPSERITLDTFSAKFGITKTYFSHLFRDNMGVTFKQYLTLLRMECAKQMLSKESPSVIDIGFECGFLTPSQFVRSFKKYTGMTPSQYRAKHI